MVTITIIVEEDSLLPPAFIHVDPLALLRTPYLLGQGCLFLTTPAHMSTLLPFLLWDPLTSCTWAWAAPDCQLVTSAYSHFPT